MAASVIGGRLFICEGEAFIEASLQDDGKGHMKFRSAIFIDRPEDVSKVEVFMAVSELQSKTKGLAISCSLDSSGKFLVMVEMDVLADAHTLTRHARKYVENIADALFEAEISLLELSRRKELV